MMTTNFTATTLKDVSAEDFIDAYAKHLKTQGKFVVPKWSDIVKTAAFKELAPYDPDWMYTRAAAIARRVYIRPNVGVGALRKIFGGSKRFGGRPSHFALAAGKIERYILQQFTAMGLMEESKATKGGRMLTSKGRQELDYVSTHMAAKKPVTH
jgi:small subunit ribosomal protein S19e